MRRLRLLATVLATVALSACESSTDIDPSGLRVRKDDGALVIENRTGAPVYTFVIERNNGELILWGPCSDPATCDAIEADGTGRIPYGEIYGYGVGDEEAVVHWWHLVPQPGGGYAPDGIRSKVVRL